MYIFPLQENTSVKFLKVLVWYYSCFSSFLFFVITDVIMCMTFKERKISQFSAIIIGFKVIVLYRDKEAKMTHSEYIPGCSPTPSAAPSPAPALPLLTPSPHGEDNFLLILQEDLPHPPLTESWKWSSYEAVSG